MGRAVVMEIKNKSAVVMTDQGEFLNIRMRTPLEIGQELYANSFEEIRESRGIVSKLPFVYAAAAVVLLGLTTLIAPSLMDNKNIVAYVGLDSLPGYELAIDDKGNVSDVIVPEGQDKQLIASADIKNRNIAEVAGELTANAAKNELQTDGKDSAVIKVVPAKTDEKTLNKTSKLTEEIKNSTEQKMAEANIPGQLETVTGQNDTSAADDELSAGEYVILMKDGSQDIDSDAGVGEDNTTGSAIDQN